MLVHGLRPVDKPEHLGHVTCDEPRLAVMLDHPYLGGAEPDTVADLGAEWVMRQRKKAPESGLFWPETGAKVARNGLFSMCFEPMRPAEGGRPVDDH
jgi:hypothetical protein